MIPIDFDIRTRVIFEPGAVARLGEFARSLTDSRVLVVSDPGIIAAGHTARALANLAAAGLTARLFDGVRENPSTDDVQQGVELAHEFRPGLIIGFGGGSSMDCAKGINFVHSGGGTMHDYKGIGKARGDLLPMIAVPTTAGTGSETQSFALISDSQTHVKMACGDKRAACRIAILDPELTVTQPRGVTALTGIDAISHALETFVTTKRNAMSRAFSQAAWNRLWWAFPKVLDEPLNVHARGEMQLGAALAGLAIESSMLGAAHAMANPLTAQFDIAHGQAVGIMLPHVVRHNAQDPRVAEDYETLLHSGEGGRSSTPVDRTEVSAADQIAHGLMARLTQAGLATHLISLGVPTSAISSLAEQAGAQWTGTFNPVVMSADSFAAIYRAAM